VSTADLIWGIVIIGAGVFIAVYGTLLFKFALAAIGFGLGFLAAFELLKDQSDTVRVLIAFVAGGIGALVLFGLVRFSFRIAGAILGLVLGFVVAGIIGIVGSNPAGWLVAVLAVAGGVGGGYFGPRLGDLVIILGTAAAGSFMIIEGLQVLFESRFNSDTADPGDDLAQKLTLVLFVIIFAISALSQYNSSSLRRRLIR
jgi:Domain of unknown function (DUF4203)